MIFELIFLIPLFVAVALTSPMAKAQTCSCSDYSRYCGEHGECLIEGNCIFSCNCSHGWTGVQCDKPCNRKCNEGVCYLEGNQEHCACPFGFTRSSNCSERKKMGTLKKKTPDIDNRWLIVSVAAPVLMLFLLTMTFYLLWKRRVSFAMRIVHYFQWQNYDENKEYDAFVSFRSCENDELWVLNTLFPKLEKDMGFRLCIHLRDFTAGEFISNNIIDAIEKSRRTILVISPDYVTSEWTRMEYQVAQQEMLKLQHKIIPIMFRNISDMSSMDKCLKFILQTVTYIKWPGHTDEKSQQQFWKQLEQTMPKRRTKITEITAIS